MTDEVGKASQEITYWSELLGGVRLYEWKLNALWQKRVSRRTWTMKIPLLGRLESPCYEMDHKSIY